MSQQRLDHATADYEQWRDAIWQETQQRYIDAKEVEAVPSIPFGNVAAEQAARVVTLTTVSANGTGDNGRARMLGEIKESPCE